MDRPTFEPGPLAEVECFVDDDRWTLIDELAQVDPVGRLVHAMAVAAFQESHLEVAGLDAGAAMLPRPGSAELHGACGLRRQGDAPPGDGAQ